MLVERLCGLSPIQQKQNLPHDHVHSSWSCVLGLARRWNDIFSGNNRAPSLEAAVQLSTSTLIFADFAEVSAACTCFTEACIIIAPCDFLLRTFSEPSCMSRASYITQKLFLRTAHTSAKHVWKTSQCNSAEQISKTLIPTLYTTYHPSTYAKHFRTQGTPVSHHALQKLPSRKSSTGSSKYGHSSGTLNCRQTTTALPISQM